MGKDTEERTGTPTLFVVLGLASEDWMSPEKLTVRLRQITDAELEAGLFDSPLGEKDNVRVFSLTRSMRAVMKYGAGVVLEIDFKGVTIWLDSIRYIQRWSDADARLRWTATTKAVQRAADAAKGAARGEVFYEALDPIRDAYRAARGTHKSQLLAAIVQYITHS